MEERGTLVGGLSLCLFHAAGQVGEPATVLVHQFCEGSLLDDDAVIDHGETVALLDSRQPVGHDNRCAITHDRVEGLLDFPLRVLVQCTGCLVEKENTWVADDGSGDGNPLLLTAREFATAVAGEDFEASVEFG